MLRLNENNCRQIRIAVGKRWTEKTVQSHCPKGSWNSSRYIQISTSYPDMELHYEYSDGDLCLHFEGKFVDSDLIRYVRREAPTDELFRWRRRYGMTQGECCFWQDIETIEDFMDALEQMIEKYDSLINGFINQHPNLSPPVVTPVNLAYQEPIAQQVDATPLETQVVRLKDIPFDKLIIPPYQRPYKWTAQNVNQLITDIISFQDYSAYRLGSLVLHNYDIVDGQQRTITLCLILHYIFEQRTEELSDEMKVVKERVKTFVTQRSFQDIYSIHNIVENTKVVATRWGDVCSDTFLHFLLRKCEFVVIRLADISEAFQFFDSQNARGKDLAAHDLLKAYHLREIDSLSEKDSQNIDTWQQQNTDDLQNLFLTLYRAKRWAQGLSACYFTKKNVDSFKGLSLKNKKRYPFYQMEVIAYVFSRYYASDPMRKIDMQVMEYPFNLDDQIINGSCFFDMIRYYVGLYKKIQDPASYISENASKIIKTLEEYNGSERVGDQYVKNMFYTAMLYYVDRFGWEELDKIVPKLFSWAYMLRLQKSAVQLYTSDNYASASNSMLRTIHLAQSPYDIINLPLERIEKSKIVCTKCKEIIDLLTQTKTIYEQQ